MDNAKIFSELVSKSRSLAKISERRLQSLLVCEIIDWKLGFSILLQGQRGGHDTVPGAPPACAYGVKKSFLIKVRFVSERHRLLAYIEEGLRGGRTHRSPPPCVRYWLLYLQLHCQLSASCRPGFHFHACIYVVNCKQLFTKYRRSSSSSCQIKTDLSNFCDKYSIQC